MLLLRKIVLIWWLRIIFFLVLSFLFFLFFNLVLPSFLLIYQFDILLSLLFSTILIELPRFKIYRHYFGLKFNKSTLKNIFHGFLLTFFSMSSILLFCLAANIEITYNKNLDIIALLSNLLFLFTISFYEELFFRGVIFQTLIQRFDHKYIIFLISLIFAFAHINNHYFNPISMINILIAGLLLGYNLLKKADLWYCISFHFFWNFLQFFILGSPVSGFKYDTYLFKINFNHLNENLSLLIGNNFGIEAGLLTSLILIYLLYNVIYNMKINFNNHKLLYKRNLMEKYFINSL